VNRRPRFTTFSPQERLQLLRRPAATPPLLLNEPLTVGEGGDASIGTKLVAASAVIIWIAVLFCGHMLPFLGNSF
jgi:hypothetical protein